MSALERGWCAREVQAELPGLGVVSLPANVAHGRPLDARSPRSVSERLRQLSNRWRGARAVNVRQEHVPAAYRVFFRQIGLDPDVVRTPIEAVVLERMMDGGLLSKGLLADVLTIALMDTCVPAWALERATLDGPLGVRLGDDGKLVLADSRQELAVLFGEIAEPHRPRPSSRELLLFSVQVPGVPSLHVEEALWGACALLEEG